MSFNRYVRGRGNLPRRVFLACPAGDGKWHEAFIASLFVSQLVLDAGGIAADLCLHSHDCHVDDARNALVRQFMRSDADDLVFLDADVGWQASDLYKLVTYDRDVVAGAYPKKQDEPEFPVHWLHGDIWSDADGLIEVAGAPTGFMRIRRCVLERLIETHQSRGFRGNGSSIDDTLYYPIFERMIDGGSRWSGDYAFCRKWRALGGKVFIDPEMRFTHTGERKWEGSVGDHMRARAGVLNPVIAQLVARLRAGDASPRLFSDLFDAWGNPWAATPELLFAIYKLATVTRGPILETGSGLSTLVLAAAAERSGAAVFSFEHDISYLDKTKAALNALGLNAHVYYTPLMHHDAVTWYDLRSCVLPSVFSLVLCDGPPRKYGREGLFSVLGESIENAVIVMDDAQVVPLSLSGRKIETIGETRPFLVAR